MKLKNQKGFTLIELMVVIVIIGILAAVAIPKMFGMSAKAKASEVGPAVAGWERAQGAYMMETSGGGTFLEIGWQNPSAESKNFTYTETAASTGATMTARGTGTLGNCATVAGANDWISGMITTNNGQSARVAPTGANCASLTPNFN